MVRLSAKTSGTLYGPEMRTIRTKVSYRATPPLRDASSKPQLRSAMPISASAAPASVNAPARRRNRPGPVSTRRATKNRPTGNRTASTSTARSPALSPTVTTVSRILAVKANPRQPTAIESRLDQVLCSDGDGPASAAASTAATNQTRSKVTRDCSPGTRTQGNASTLSGTHSSNAGRSSLWKRSARTSTHAMPSSNAPSRAPWLPTSQPSRSVPASAASHPSRQSTRGRRSARPRRSSAPVAAALPLPVRRVTPEVVSRDQLAETRAPCAGSRAAARQGAVGEVDQQRDALRTPAVVRPVDAPSLHPDRSTADQVPGQVDEVAHLAKRAPALAFVEIPVIRWDLPGKHPADDL